ncbi:MAG TPA: ABC-type transport auxiliary lipoprotein family protein [Xanthobacteraceae bacterium]|nr:ABC-type transport auxiliary lipoprotein family protein [Xanthobacteraceae bacterium]
MTAFTISRRGFVPAFLLALALGGCAGGGGDGGFQTFELLAPQEFTDARRARGTLSVALPTTIRVIDSERVIIQPTPGEVNYLSGARWSDRVPRLVQTRIMQAFENSGRVRAVTREGDSLRTDYKLDTEIREFGVFVSPQKQALVELSVKLVNAQTNRVVAAEVFSARADTASVDGPSATAAINSAFGTVLIELVRWTTQRI